jgi:uronate dehydrogenase
MTGPTAPVLLTGASGALGRHLAGSLSERGWTLRLTDIASFPDKLPPGASFGAADLADRDAVLALAEGCGTLLHFGGVSMERPFDEILEPNLRGTYNVFEAARRNGARVVFASSNHVIGFHPRSATLDRDHPMRPDGYYGLSKAYGELLAQLYWDKHGVESVSLRIGSCVPQPANARMLSTWLSYPDLVRLVTRAATAPDVGCAVVWGVSANARSFWRLDDRARIGWAPEDSADPFAAALALVTSGSAVEERFQGGPYCAIDYDRKVTA